MAEPTVGRAALLRAVNAGAMAAQAGVAVTACPWSVTSTDVDQRLRAAAWVRGWTKATNGPGS